MARRKPAKAQTSERQESANLDARARAWELHLRAVSRRRIAEQVGVNRQTVGVYIAACYAEVEGETRRAQLKRKLTAAIVRMRRVQEQAWSDHDADDEREQAVLSLVLGSVTGNVTDEGVQEADRDGGDAPKPRRSGGAARYQSQRSQYLRVILDAEKEIARLEGLYESVGDVEGAVVFRIERVGSGRVTTEGTEDTEGGEVIRSTALSAGVGDEDGE